MQRNKPQEMQQLDRLQPASLPVPFQTLTERNQGNSCFPTMLCSQEDRASELPAQEAR